LKSTSDKTIKRPEIIDFLDKRTEETVSCVFFEREPLVSVCVVTYNHVKFIGQTIESILSQETAFPFEIIVADDFSIDGTTALVSDYQARYPEKIRLIRATENLGQYSPNYCLNAIRALHVARAPFIHSIEGDDYWCDSKKLQKQVAVLEKHPDYSACCHETKVEWVNPNKATYSVFLRERNIPNPLELKDVLRIEPLFHTSSLMARREYIDSLPVGFSIHLSADLYLQGWLAGHGKIYRLPDVMSVYRKHEGGVTSNAHFKRNFAVKRYQLYCDLREELGIHHRSDFAEVLNEVRTAFIEAIEKSETRLQDVVISIDQLIRQTSTGFASTVLVALGFRALKRKFLRLLKFGALIRTIIAGPFASYKNTLPRSRCRIILFGASEAGARAYKNLCVHHDVFAFADNDSEKQGTKFFELPVYRPTEICTLEYEFIVVTSMYVTAISRQLRELGVGKGKIIFEAESRLDALANLLDGQVDE
jgi:glycosyltransferase involved in cell wall biosynthesis